MGHSAVPTMANFDERRWVIQIRRSLEEDDDEEFPVCVFNVPKVLTSCKEECYAPQIVAIGPYHHWRPEIFEMERYKLAAAKRTQKRLTATKFKTLVQLLSEHEQKIRGCYHKYLDYNGETLTWMTTLDLSFLLEILHAQVHTAKKGPSLNSVSSGMSHLLDYSGRKSAHNAILRDIIMLENQVPLFLLRKYLEVEYCSVEAADEVLSSMLAGFCKKLSPCNTPNIHHIDLSEVSHLLDFVYKCIIPNNDFASEPVVIPIIDGEDKSSKPEVSENYSYVRQQVRKLRNGPVQKLRTILLSRLPTVTSKIPGFYILSQTIQTLFFQGNKQDEKPDEEHRPPSVEQITIPSVTELYRSGVRFLPSYGDIQSMSFNCRTGIFMLPMVCLDGNTEVVLRNLVAYEALIVTGPLVFTRYTEFMNGIIDTEEDAKLLREKGIILNHLKSDREVADLWNGMSRSVRLTKVQSLDKVIGDVNRYYSAKWKIKIKKYVRVYVFESWKFLTFLAAILLLLLMGLQLFCSIYSCAKTFHASESVAPLITPTD